MAGAAKAVELQVWEVAPGLLLAPPRARYLEQDFGGKGYSGTPS